MRELRLKMKQKGAARGPVDGELIRPSWVREPGGRESSVSDFDIRISELLRWGTDEETGQQRVRVTDNGVDVTEDVIKDYFTQIGKSYHRSPEFTQARAAMKAAERIRRAHLPILVRTHVTYNCPQRSCAFGALPCMSNRYD